MPNFDVRDAYGSVITIESSVVGGANRQVITAALGNSSVVLLGGANVIGSVAVLQGTNPWVIGSVSGTVNIAGNPSISGTIDIGTIPGSVIAFQGGVWTPSVSGTVGASIVGQLPAGAAVLGSIATLQGTNPWIISGSVMLLNGANIVGSVTTLQGTNPWRTLGSVSGTVDIGTQSGSVVAFQGGGWTPSAIAYLRRNDAIASTLGADLTYGPGARDSAGRILTRPYSAEESRIEGYASTVNLNANIIIAAAGTGLRNYVTDVWVANTGAAATLVTFLSGGGLSVLGYTIAPATGGSNLPGLVTPMRTGAGETFDFRAATGTSVLYITAKGFTAP